MRFPVFDLPCIPFVLPMLMSRVWSRRQVTLRLQGVPTTCVGVPANRPCVAHHTSESVARVPLFYCVFQGGSGKTYTGPFRAFFQEVFSPSVTPAPPCCVLIPFPTSGLLCTHYRFVLRCSFASSPFSVFAPAAHHPTMPPTQGITPLSYPTQGLVLALDVLLSCEIPLRPELAAISFENEGFGVVSIDVSVSHFAKDGPLGPLHSLCHTLAFQALTCCPSRFQRRFHHQQRRHRAPPPHAQIIS